jgi:phosphopantothenoylcysteine decarboxylase/phosphopantothenate--cysteine ligase
VPADPAAGGRRLDGRFVVLGVSGGIAAYKAVEVCRRLGDLGARVAPVLTANATRFIAPLTFSAVAAEPARISLYEAPEPSPHTTLGQAADLVVVAPCTAGVLGRYAAGIADDLLTATLLATRAPVLLCPAMHTEMWEHPAVQDNLATVRRRGVQVVEPGVGHLAGGDSGPGRLAEPEDIVFAVERLLGPADLTGASVIVTAGGTREAIDPVRVITNRSSGKQGYALAAEAAVRGAEVTLVTTTDRTLPPGIAHVVPVSSAADMQAAVTAAAPRADVVIMAAAVADFRPKEVADHKIKKDEGLTELVLEPTHDFLVDLGRDKPPGQVLVGFAAETSDLQANAADKLRRKRLDLIVGNDVSAASVGFEHDTNEVVLLTGDGALHHVPLTDKRSVAAAVLDAVVRLRSRARGDTTS